MKTASNDQRIEFVKQQLAYHLESDSDVSKTREILLMTVALEVVPDIIRVRKKNNQSDESEQTLYILLAELFYDPAMASFHHPKLQKKPVKVPWARDLLFLEPFLTKGLFSRAFQELRKPTGPAGERGEYERIRNLERAMEQAAEALKGKLTRH